MRCAIAPNHTPSVDKVFLINFTVELCGLRLTLIPPPSFDLHTHTLSLDFHFMCVYLNTEIFIETKKNILKHEALKSSTKSELLVYGVRESTNLHILNPTSVGWLVDNIHKFLFSHSFRTERKHFNLLLQSSTRECPTAYRIIYLSKKPNANKERQEERKQN